MTSRQDAGCHRAFQVPGVSESRVSPAAPPLMGRRCDLGAGPTSGIASSRGFSAWASGLIYCERTLPCLAVLLRGPAWARSSALS